MARIPQEPKEEHIAYLKSLVHIGFANNVTTTYDCIMLSESIESNINEKVSVDTLRRFFGAIKSTSLPSTYTLDVLSKYVGYKSWTTLILGYQKQNELYQKNLLFELITKNITFKELLVRFTNFPKTKQVYDLFNQIILIKAEQKESTFFENIFKFEMIFTFQELFKYEIYHTIHLIGSLCVTNKWLQEIAVEKYYNLSFAEDYFVEWLVVPEHSYYLEVFEKYFHVNKMI